MTVRTTVLVVTWRGRAHVGRCLDALAGQSRPLRTVVVDNASADGTAELLAGHPSRPDVLRMPANLGYAGGLAAALPDVHTEFVAWLNDDAAPEPGWLAALENALDADPAAAAVGSALLPPEGGPPALGVRLTALGYGADTSEEAEVFGFCGGAALLRRQALLAVGGVPAGFFCYYEDTDTAWRLRLAGWTVRPEPAARAAHVLGASTRPGSPSFHLWNERNRLLMLLRCAPAAVAGRELARFAAITLLLPVRRLARRPVPAAANFRVGLRLRVLGAVAVRLPRALRDRGRIGRRATVPRNEIWHTFAR
ncbi:glycosyltransferase family 2 protein [Actinophytocola sp.]|uniref:glycosyltransferase family 2 protein n=1 Tax=Actinophytocola sp. TaxID=1872138 RepID=UPI002D7EDB85|nr:glycosyltransferase family 2 protein [Actinophytocola sp.]HET9140903.1 glycosyltransferase family 2 protein [Actinophytocola sp.]